LFGYGVGDAQLAVLVDQARSVGREAHWTSCPARPNSAANSSGRATPARPADGK
jgi:hypothetical protein